MNANDELPSRLQIGGNNPPEAIEIEQPRYDREPELIPIKAACPLVPCSLPTMYELIRSGSVLAYKIGRSTMIDPASLRAGVRKVPLVLPPKAAAPVERPAKRVVPAQPAKKKRAKKGQGKSARTVKPSARRPRAGRTSAAA